MNKLQTGESYTAVKAESGKSRIRDWEMLLTRDANGKNNIAIIVKNIPSHINEGDTFRLDKIISVTTSKARVTRRWFWEQAIAIEAEVTKVEDCFK